MYKSGCKELIHLHCIRQLVEFNNDHRHTHTHPTHLLYAGPIIQWKMRLPKTNDTQKFYIGFSHMFSISKQTDITQTVQYYFSFFFDFKKFVHYKSSTHTKISIKSSNMHITFCLPLLQIRLRRKLFFSFCLFGKNVFQHIRFDVKIISI